MCQGLRSISSEVQLDEEGNEDEESEESGDDSDGEEMEDDGEPASKRAKTSRSQEEGNGHIEDEDGDEDEEESAEDDIDLESIIPVDLEDERKPNEVESIALASLNNVDGEAVMQWLCSPMDLDSFLDDVFEKRAALIRRVNNPNYYGNIMSTKDIRKLIENGLKYGLEVDVTTYSADGRSTLNYNDDAARNQGTNASDTNMQRKSNDVVVADPEVVWKRFNNEKCSIRVLHPQRLVDGVWRVIAAMENFWMCPVGSNAYLTPPNSQGFAPHWDDIDAFILQLEGQKRWRLYAPTSEMNILPLRSSRDFNREELGEKIFDVVLQPGDFLYLPRGTVHEAETVGEQPSLHLTISANQDRSYAALLQELLPRAVAVAAQKNVFLRQTVTKDFLRLFGSVLPSAADPAVNAARKMFASHATQCWHSIAEEIDLDWGADQLASEFMLQRMPPPSSLKVDSKSMEGQASPSTMSVTEASWVQVAHPGTVRVMIEEDVEMPMAIVCHSLSNERAAHASFPEDEEEGQGQEPGTDDIRSVPSDSKRPPPQLEYPIACAELLSDALFETRPVKVGDLPSLGDDAGVTSSEVLQSLVSSGLLRVISEPQHS